MIVPLWLYRVSPVELTTLFLQLDPLMVRIFFFFFEKGYLQGDSGAKITPTRIGTANTHCSANGSRYDHFDCEFTKARTTPTPQICPSSQHMFTLLRRYARIATGMTSAAYVVVKV